MFTMRVEGGAELAKALDGLSTRLTKSIVRDALYMGGEPIRKVAGENAPRRAPAPDMADHIGISNAKPREDDIAAVAIGPTKDFYYGLFQELGTIHHAAHAFMRPAFDTQAPKGLTLIGEELWRALASRGVIRTATEDTPVQSPGRGGLT